MAEPLPDKFPIAAAPASLPLPSELVTIALAFAAGDEAKSQR